MIGRFCSISRFREYVVGVNIHGKSRWSSLSIRLEYLVGEYGYARYSYRVSVIRKFRWYHGNFFVLSLWLGTFFVKECFYAKRIT